MNRLLKKKMIPQVKDFWNTMSRGMLVLMLLLVWGSNAVSGANGAVGDTFEYQNCTYKITEVLSWTRFCELTNSNVPDTEPLIVPDYAYNSETGLEYQVTSIAGGSCKSYQGSKVVIGNRVSTIGDKAFEHFGEKGAVTLILGTNITSMSNKAFEHLGEKGNCKVFITSTSQPESIKIDHQTFEHVKQTTFYLANDDLYTKYKADSNWKEYDEPNNNKGNSYSCPFPYKYEDPKQTQGWRTFIGPEDMDNYYIESIFGHGTKVAYLKEAQWLSGKATYNLTFAETTTIKANTPYFINPTNNSFAYITEAKLKECDNNCTSVAVQDKDGYYAQMIGNASDEDYYLKKNEFYFRNYNGLYFYVAVEDSKNYVSPNKCHFRITEGNTSTTPVLAKVAMFIDFDDSTTGITETEAKTQTTKGIYDIHGIYRGNNLQNLPKGLYIVNGKKIIK